MATEIDEDDCIVFTIARIVCPQWPVKVAGQQGLWRYVGPIETKDGWTHAEVIGPMFPGAASRSGGRSRILNIEELRYAGRNAKPVDVQHQETIAISNSAKHGGRR
jgi:hypothetical protein